MYKIPPSYHMKRALKAEDIGSAITSWYYHFQMMHTRNLHVVTNYVKGMTDLSKKIFESSIPKG